MVVVYRRLFQCVSVCVQMLSDLQFCLSSDSRVPAALELLFCVSYALAAVCCLVLSPVVCMYHATSIIVIPSKEIVNVLV